MATLNQAEYALGYTRIFFEGGLKSSNKQYDGSFSLFAEKNARALLKRTDSISLAEAEARANQRNTNQALAAPLTAADNFAGRTPVEFGRDRVNGVQRHGNCGAMACVAMHFATSGGTPDGLGPLADTDVYLVTVTNPTMTYSTWKMGNHGGKAMSFGHSWAQLGSTASGGAFIVDPWAGVACAKADYSAALTNKLNRWHSQNKRINIGWGNGPTAVGIWTNANDASILSLLDIATRTTIALRGDGFNVPGRPPA
jgi:hypothetical protein